MVGVSFDGPRTRTVRHGDGRRWRRARPGPCHTQTVAYVRLRRMQTRMWYFAARQLSLDFLRGFGAVRPRRRLRLHRTITTENQGYQGVRNVRRATTQVGIQHPQFAAGALSTRDARHDVSTRQKAGLDPSDLAIAAAPSRAAAGGGRARVTALLKKHMRLSFSKGILKHRIPPHHDESAQRADFELLGARPRGSSGRVLRARGKLVGSRLQRRSGDGARASTASSTTFGGSARGDGGRAGSSKPRPCKQGSVIPGRTTRLTSRLVGDLIGCGAGGGRGGVDSLETSRVALGGVFESEIGARCASVILECCLLGARGRAKSPMPRNQICRPEFPFGQALLADARARRGVPPSKWLVLARPRAPAQGSARSVAFFVAD